MTLVVGIKVDGSIWLAADALSSNAEAYQQLVAPKIFPRDNMWVGFSGGFRPAQLVQYMDPVPRDHDDILVWLIKSFVPAVRAAYEAGGFAHNEDDYTTDFAFLFAGRGRLFCMGTDFAVIELHQDYDAIGIGHDYACGAIEVLQRVPHNLSPQDLLRVVFESVAARCNKVGPMTHIQGIGEL